MHGSLLAYGQYLTHGNGIPIFFEVKMTKTTLLTLGFVSLLLAGCTVWTGTQAKQACMEKLESLENNARTQIIVDEARSTEKAETWSQYMNNVVQAGNEVVFRRFVNKARAQAGKILGPRQNSLEVSRFVYIRYMRQVKTKADGPWVDNAYMVATCVAVYDDRTDRTLTNLQRYVYSKT